MSFYEGTELTDVEIANVVISNAQDAKYRYSDE